MVNPQIPSMPKKACMITIMFAIDNNEKALDIKQAIDKIITDLPDKRYTFQIIET